MKIKKNLLYGNNTITDYLPKIEKKDEIGIMWLLSNIDNRFLAHRFDVSWISMDKNMKYDLFGQSNWRYNIYKNKNHTFNKLFSEVYVGTSFQKVSNAYEPTQLLIDGFSKWLYENKSTYELIEVNNKKVRVKNVEITNCDEERSDFYEEIEINIKPIKKYFFDLIQKDSITKEDFLRKILPSKSFFDYIVENDNRLKIHYKQSHSGRYYSVGQYSVHSLKKEVRNVILNDYNEYDISVSAPLLLSQIYKDITKEKVPKSISDFIKNKSRIRELLSEKYNIPLENSKTFFTSLFFGSRLQENDFYYHSSVTKTVSQEVVNEILSDEDTYEYKLYYDIKKVFDVISKHYKKIDSKKVVGYNNHTLQLKKWNKSKVVAHIYQSLESMILESMIKFYTSTTNDYNYVRVHDCLYTKEKIDIYEMYQFVLKDTDFNILLREPISKQYSDEVLYEMFKMKRT